MPDWSRRNALKAVAAVGTLALAGCSDEPSSLRSAPPDRGDRVTDYELVYIRNTDGEPVFYAGEQTTEDTEDGAGPDRRGSGMEYVTEAADVEELRFRNVPPASEMASFVRNTDLESRSIYLLQRQVGECYEPRLVGVFREGDGVDADFCRELRPADVACDADAHDVFAVAIRLPFPGDEFNSLGSGMSSDCNHRRSVPLTETETGTGEGGDGS